MSTHLRSRFLFLALLGGVGVGLWAQRTRRPYSFRNQTVLVTGGSRGLGLVLARQLAAEGAKIALLARSEAELERAEQDLEARGASILLLGCDVRKREQVEHAVQRVCEYFGGVDVLINNAGIMQVGPLEHMSLDDFEEAFAVHLYGPLYTTLAALPSMQRAGGGRIVNISSIGGRVAIPHMLPYVASKFALSGFSEALGAELRRQNICVTTVYPAPMRTGSPPNATFKGKHAKEYAWFSIMDSLPLLSLSAERAASKIIEACRRGAPRLALGVHTKAAILLNDLFPGATLRMLAVVNRLMPAPDPNATTESYTGWESHSSLSPSAITRLSDQATAKNNQGPVVLR